MYAKTLKTNTGGGGNKSTICTFSCQEKTAIVTYNLIRTHKSNGSQVRLKTSEVWIGINEKWLRLHRHSSELAWRFENTIRTFEQKMIQLHHH